MAINNWRYVVTWGYIDPNGNLVEETKYVPDVTYSPDHITGQINSLLDWTKTAGQIRAEDGIYKTSTPVISSPTFTNAEVYGLQSQGYANQGDNAMANAFWSLANDLGQYSTYANTTLWAYDSLLNYIQWNESKLQSAAWKLYNELTSDIQSQKDYVNQMFWPNWELTKEVNTYYDDLGNYLATDAGRQAANIAAQWVHSWASLGSIRAQQNEAYNESFARYVQAKEQQINAKQQIASNLINFMSTLRKEYWDTTNQYIIELYKRANDLYNNVAISAAQDIENYNKLRLSSSWSSSSNPGWITLWTLPSWLSYDSNWNVVDSAWNRYELRNWVYTKVNPAVIKNAQNSLWQTPSQSLWQVIKSETWVNPEKSLLNNIVSSLNPVNVAKTVRTIADPESAVKSILGNKNLTSSIVNSIIKKK